MGQAGLFCGDLLKGFVNAERIQRYRTAYPEDLRADQEILVELNAAQQKKKTINRLIEKAVKRFCN